jgi:hypothetical protein
MTDRARYVVFRSLWRAYPTSHTRLLNVCEFLPRKLSVDD